MSSNILEIINLSVKVAGKELLHGLNLSIPEGEVHALLGQNGSGKTSLMMAIMGFPGYEISEGQILFEGRDITGLGLTERARLGIGIAGQRPPTIPGVKLRDVLEYILRDNPSFAEEIDELAKACKMETFLDRDIHEGLSGGEIKRAEVLQLLASKPLFSMLDEPDSGLDIEAMSSVGELMNRVFSDDDLHPAKRKAGLIITHNGQILNHVHVDKAHILLNGKIACSSNPRIMMETVSQRGYEACIRCMKKGV